MTKRLTEQQVKSLIMKAQLLAYPTRAAAEVLAPLYEYVEQTEAELQKYRQAEAEGRLVVLPCKVGDVVYKVDFGNGFNEPKINKHVVRGFTHTVYANYPLFDIVFFGKTVFLTREEAEAELAAQKGGGE